MWLVLYIATVASLSALTHLPNGAQDTQALYGDLQD